MLVREGDPWPRTRALAYGRAACLVVLACPQGHVAWVLPLAPASPRGFGVFGSKRAGALPIGRRARYLCARRVDVGWGSGKESGVWCGPRMGFEIFF